MQKLVVNSYDEFASHLGQELGSSEWLLVDQDRINLFADATLDHQWIHVDVDRAKNESQYKNTIAHGYLTLSLLPYMWDQIIEVRNIKMLVNYGRDKMRESMSFVNTDMMSPCARLSKYFKGRNCMCLKVSSRSLFNVPWLTLIISRL